MVLCPRSTLIGMCPVEEEIPGLMAKRNCKIWQSPEPNMVIMLLMQVLRIGGGLITLKVQKVLMIGGNFSCLNHRGWLLEVSVQ